jgi:SAM-dependent methyltransferase
MSTNDLHKLLTLELIHRLFIDDSGGNGLRDQSSFDWANSIELATG